MKKTIKKRAPSKGKDKKTKRGRGRPSKYDEVNFPRMAYIACSRMGAKNEDLAKLFSVAVDTIAEWMNIHEEFSESIKNGRDIWNSNEAEVAMQKIVTGYEYEEVTITKDSNGKTVVTKTKKHIKPDIKAIMFWLQNRDGIRWKNVSRVEASGEIKHTHSGKVDMKVDLKKLEKDEVVNLRNIIVKATADAGRS